MFHSAKLWITWSVMFICQKLDNIMDTVFFIVCKIYLSLVQKCLPGRLKAKSHRKAISDLSRINLIWNSCPKSYSRLRTKSVNKTPHHAVSTLWLKEMGWDFLDYKTCNGLAKDRSVLVDIVEICTQKNWSLCRHRDSATKSPVKSFPNQSTLPFVFQDLTQFGLLQRKLTASLKFVCPWTNFVLWRWF